jgi:hypothetical protein
MPSATSWSSAEVTSSQMMKVGFGGQRPGDADALLLPARELRRIAVVVLRRLQLDLVEQLVHPLLLLHALEAGRTRPAAR